MSHAPDNELRKLMWIGRNRNSLFAACASLAMLAACGAQPEPLLPAESVAPIDRDRFTLLARWAHISDSHIVDEESPARLTAFAALSNSAWRPQEAYSTQLLDGFVRTINKIHIAQSPIDFVIHTGDAVDNSQLNELRWFVTAMDGGTIDPTSRTDDRAQRPELSLDPHAPFEAQGLYRNGVHGSAPTISWYSVMGNHDRLAVGVFPIVTDGQGRRVSPLPLPQRPGIHLPSLLNPTGSLAIAPITPNNPGPPPATSFVTIVPQNADRRFITETEFIAAHLASPGEPRGHGFDAAAPTRTWYSTSPTAGLRLIALNTSSAANEQATLPFSEGAISIDQRRFLEAELQKAQANNEYVVIATHHPSESLVTAYGTALTTMSFREMLNAYPCVKLHLAGHLHQHAVFDRGGYVEVVTGSIIDAPQQGRIIELWREVASTTGIDNNASDDDRAIEIRYRFFSHLDSIDAPDDPHEDLFADPLRALRQAAQDLANASSQ